MIFGTHTPIFAQYFDYIFLFFFSKNTLLVQTYYFFFSIIIEVKEGEPITLSCSTSDHYEWCKFIHKEHGKECDFVWTRQAWNITTLNCTDYENRAFYTGDYDNNICAITIISTTIEDTGDW